MSVQVKLIPLFPRGRPRDGRTASFLEEVLTYAHVAVAQAIEPKGPLADPRAASELTDHECFGRLDRRALTQLGRARRPLVVILTWRPGVDDDQTVIAFLYRLYLETCVERRPTIMATADARHAIVLRSAEDVRDFEEYFQVNESGITDTVVGRIFVIYPQARLTSADVGFRLSAFLYEGNSSASIRPPAFAFRRTEKMRSIRRSSLKGFNFVSRLFRRKTR